jgi:hypothetical protein
MRSPRQGARLINAANRQIVSFGCKINALVGQIVQTQFVSMG